MLNWIVAVCKRLGRMLILLLLCWSKSSFATPYVIEGIDVTEQSFQLSEMNSNLGNSDSTLPEDQKPTMAMTIFTIGVGVIIGANAGAQFLPKVVSCEGEECLGAFLLGTMLGGVSGGYAGYRILRSKVKIGAGVELGIYKPNNWLFNSLIADKNGRSLHVAYSTGLSIGLYFDKKLNERHILSPYINYSDFSTEEQSSIETGEIGLKYKYRHQLYNRTFLSGGGFGYGAAQSEIIRPNVAVVNERSNYVSFHAFTEFVFKFCNVELGARAYRNNKIGVRKYKPGLYVGVDYPF